MIIKKLGWITAVAAMLAGCGVSGERGHTLEEQIQSVVRDVDGTVGIAFIGNGDTVVVNNDLRFAMMSVFKLHQALAVGNAVSIDTVIGISQSELDHHTWSPMLTTYGNEDFDISVRELISHALVESDNNASNILFDRIVSPDDTERFVKSIASDTTFAIRYSEADMKRNNDLSYDNYSSPLSAGLLMLQIFTTDLLPTESLDAIREDLKAVTTGKNRIYMPA